MAPVYIGLIHYPIYNKHMEVVTTALTNYDLHDIARTAKTYDVKKYFIVHPVEAQREMALRIMNHWKTGGGVHYNANRKEAFEETELVPTLEDAISWIEKKPAENRLLSPPTPGCILILSPTQPCEGKSTTRILPSSFSSVQASA